MAVSVEQFMKGLEQSGLVSPGNLRAVREKLPHERQDDAQEFARELVRRKVLTTYQVKEAYQGKANDLVLGNYMILDQIGQGGMGQVFKAQHRRMDRIVAIKMLPAAVSKDPGAVARFQREVKAAAKLEHPNIVTAYDADEAAGRHFLVMQYVEGQDLSALVKKNGPLPVANVVNYVLQAARGLEFAHGEGVVHRDIKPANLLLDKKGAVKVLDMGLARLESPTGAERTELTGTGQIMGTVDYMSPEQALDTKHADERSDIYSLGCTLWYLLTGHAAFGGDSVMAKLMAHREQPIPSLQAASGKATPALQAVFTKMVAKNARDRYQSMSEVVAELERFHQGQGAAARPADGDAAQPAGRDTGVISDARGEDHRLSEFLRGMKSSRHASGRATIKPGAATKRPSSPVLEATITMADGQVDTDPTTEQSLVVPAAAAWWRKVAEFVRIPSVEAQDRNSHEVRDVRWRRRLLTACAVGAAFLLLAGIVLFIETKQGTLRIDIDDPAIEVVVDGTGATIKGAKSEEIKLQPGNHGLRIKYGELDFETDKFILNRGDTVTLKVELLAGKVRVVQGDTVLGEGPNPAVVPPLAIAPFDARQAANYQETRAKHLGTEVEIENSLGMKLRLVPPGEFVMGSPQVEIDALVETNADQTWQAYFRSEGPRHPVKLTQAFYLGSCEVTQRQYEDLMGVNPSYFSLGGAGKDAVKDLDTGQFPVEMVTWFDAVDFCNKLSEKEQRPPYYVRDGEAVKILGGTGYRLPTEAEWEYACRAGTTTRWSFGDTERDLAQHAWFLSTAGGRTQRVGELLANPFGLYDLHGNVWEWCWDWHGDYAAEAVSDPTGATAGSGRVLRGGAFDGSASDCRSADRAGDRPMNRDDPSGFRVLCGR